MKTFFALAFLAATLTSAAAQTQNFYDARGNKIGSSTQIGNTTNFYDDRGRKVQSSTTTGNMTKYYDDRGRTIGSTTAPLPEREMK
jgi:YD repeat-containing protein